MVALTPPPTAPSTADKSTFSARADALIAWFATFVAEMTVLVAAIYTLVTGSPFALTYYFSTTTADADPGAGTIRLSNATQDLSTVMRVDVLAADGSDQATALDLYDDSTSATKGYLKLVKADDTTKWLLFAVTAKDASSGYRNFTVTPVTGSAASPFANGDRVILEFTRTGDKGDTGSTGVAPTLPNYIDGLGLSAAGSTATFGVAAGSAVNDLATRLMTLETAYTKTMAAWAVGTGNGALDFGSITSNTTYHIWLIERTDGTLRDYLVSLSPTAPTMPTGYTFKRLIQSMKTNGSSQWPKCFSYDDLLYLDTLPVDFNAAPPTSATNITLSVPTGIKVEALISARYRYTVASYQLWVWSPSQSDAGAFVSGNAVAWIGGGVNEGPIYNRRLLTDTSGNVRQQADANAGTHLLVLQGWRHPRGATW